MQPISIIIPVWNVEQFLPQCVNSVLTQSFAEFEVILVDDGSPDNSPEICDSFAAQDNRVRVIHKTNGGLSSARNAGLEIAAGEWILFVDADDWLEPDFISNFLRTAGDNTKPNFPSPDTLRIQGCKRIRANGETQITQFSPQKTLPATIAKNNLFAHWSAWGKLYNNTIIKQRKLRFDESPLTAEDALFFFDYLSSVNNLEVVPETAYCYRQTESGTLSKVSRTWQMHTEHAEKIRDAALPQIQRLSAGAFFYRHRFQNLLCFEQFAHRLPFLYTEQHSAAERRTLLKKTFGNRPALLSICEPLFFNNTSYLFLWLFFLLLPIRLTDSLFLSILSKKNSPPNPITRPTPPQRIIWIDYAKTFAIYLVILGHMPASPYIPHSLIYAFHMPLFFFLSGYLEKERTLFQTIKHAARTILIPYFIFWLISTTYFAVISLPRHPERWHGEFPLLRTINGLFLAGGYETPFSFVFLPSLWFFPTLFILKITGALIQKFSPKTKTKSGLLTAAIILICATATIFFHDTRILRFGGVFDCAVMALPFFAGGLFLRRHLTSDNSQKLTPLPPLLSAITGGILFITLYLILPLNFHPTETGALDCRAGSISEIFYGKNIALYYLFASLGILATYLFSATFRKEQKIIRLASNSAILFIGLQWLIYAPLLYILDEKLHLISKHSIVAATIIPAITFLILLFVAWGSSRFKVRTLNLKP